MWMSERDLSKKWRRINYSGTTKLFAIILIIQTLLVSFFQMKITFRDNRLVDEANSKFIYNLNCVKDHFNKSDITRMERESSLVIYILMFLSSIGLDTIIRQYTPQIKVFTVINFLVAFFGLTQLMGTKHLVDNFNKNCGQIRPLDPDYFTNEVPNIAISLLSAGLLGYLSYKLIGEFGDHIYKKIGTDKRMQKMFKTRLLLIMLLRMNLFFALFMFVPSVALIILSVQDLNVIGIITLSYSILHIFFSVIAFRVLLMAFTAVKKESSQKLHQFIKTWLLVLIDWTVMLLVCFVLNIVGPFFIFLFGIPFTFLGAVSIKCASNVTHTFNVGMKEYVGQELLNRKLETVVPVIKVCDGPDQNLIEIELERPAPAVIIDRSHFDEDIEK